MPEIQRAIVGYLDAERRLGRTAAAADTEAAALLLMGAVHHLLLEYVIRQTTQLSSGRVVRQVNEVRPTT